LRKTYWDCDSVESVGVIWSAEGIAMASINIDAMETVKLRETLAYLRCFLELANQFT